MRNLIEFEYSPWLIVVCLLVGAGYSLIQYTRDTPWNSTINSSLAVIRVFVVAGIAILLLGPLVRAVKNYYEDPVLIIALDNSESVGLNLDSLGSGILKNELRQINDAMADEGWQVTTVDLYGNQINLDSIKFDGTRTNLTKMIRDQLEAYSGANLGALLVVSDGIFNAGFSPDLISPFTPIYTIGLGDTIPKRDISLIDIEYNKTVYQDNRYPVNIRLRNEGIESGSGNLRIFDAGKLVERVTLDFNNQKRLVEHEFILEAKEPGKHRISVILDSIPGESTTVNNRSQFYVDIIDGKQKILLAAEAPSPEIKAFRAALSSNERFEIEQAIGRIPESDNFDLIVVFNSPSRKSSRVFNAVNELDVPKLYYLGLSTDFRPYLQQGLLNYNRITNRYDQARAATNQDLSAFNLINELDEWLANVPPMTVPFGDILVPPNGQVVIYQKVGSVTTDRPIIYLINEEPKSGVIIGDGLWTWRLDEYRNYGETVRFDELISKITQFLASRPDNRQFKLYPSKDGFEVGEEMVFVAETYNQLFEPVYGEPVALSVFTDSTNWSYTFTPLAGSNKFSIDNLPEGLYSFTGSTFIDGKRHTISGEISVDKPNVEAADLTADHLVLRKLSNESGGRFFTSDQVDQLKEEMTSKEATSIIHSQETELFLFSLPWVLVLLLLLATVEWLTRKMMGGY
jgi:hypothetical protein